MVGEHYPRVEIKSRSQWRRWLVAHHARSGPIWLVRWKKGKGPHVAYDEVVEEALCFGWIDSLPRRLDDARSMLLLAPRKPASAWSKLNRERVARLTKAGLMAPAGLAAVAAARSSGAWSALEQTDSLSPPDDLQAAFAAHPGSRENFAAFPPSTRRGILEWIAQAKRAETRAKRINETAALAVRNMRANQWRG